MKTKIALFAFLMLVPAIFAPPTQPQFPVCGNYTVTLQSVVPVAGGKYNWTYQVCGNHDPAVSHWVLQACICTEYDNDVGRCISSYGSDLGPFTLEYMPPSNPDHTTNMYGLKFDVGFSGCHTFWFVTNKNYDQIITNTSVKAGNGACNYTVVGRAISTSLLAPIFGISVDSCTIYSGSRSSGFRLHLRRMS